MIILQLLSILRGKAVRMYSIQFTFETLVSQLNIAIEAGYAFVTCEQRRKEDWGVEC